MFHPVKTIDVVAMVNPSDYISSILSGVIVALSSWLPTSPDSYTVVRVLSGVAQGYQEYLVPAYLGVTFAVLFYFKEKIALGSQNALRGRFDSEIKYFAYASIFTILLGYPLVRLTGLEGSRLADLVNSLLGLLFILAGLFLPRFRSVAQGFEDKMREERSEPTLLDSIISGILQGVSLLGGLSRSGFIILGLTLTGIDVKKALELSFLIAPAYFIMRLASMEGWNPSLPVSLLFTSFLAAFVASLITMKGLIKLSCVLGDKTFLAVFGLIGILIYLMGVVL